MESLLAEFKAALPSAELAARVTVETLRAKLIYEKRAIREGIGKRRSAIVLYVFGKSRTNLIRFVQ